MYRADAPRILASLIDLLGDFECAEDAMHDAFAAAVKQWPDSGIPANPRAWLISAGRFKAIDALRHRARFDASAAEFARRLDEETVDPIGWDDRSIPDDRLRLIFTCCHPELPPDARVALTLREVCGLTTEEIARAFLTAPATMGKRLVRAKAKIRNGRIPYAVPSPAQIGERLETVLHVIYLVFTEGYAASSGEALVRAGLTGEAIHLGRLVLELLPDPEVQGLLALMVLQESRRRARTTPDGELVLLEDQDRSLWKRDLIDEGIGLLECAFASGRVGPYTLQAAIAAEHAKAVHPAATDWEEIVALYDVLRRVSPSPIVELNRAVAIAMRDTPLVGLRLVDAILARGDLEDYYLAHAARADLCRRLGRIAEARASYARALSLALPDPVRRFLSKQAIALTEAA